MNRTDHPKVELQRLTEGGFSIFVDGKCRARCKTPDMLAAHFASLLLTCDEYKHEQQLEDYWRRQIISELDIDNEYASWSTICQELRKAKPK